MNKFVSTSSLKSLKDLNLKWIPHSGNGRQRSARSKAWDFMGDLVVCAPDGTTKQVALDDSYVYCKLCFTEQLNEREGSVAKIYKTSAVTATGNWLAHASTKHSKTFQKELPPKVTAWFQKVQEKTAATSQLEFNRDLALMMCCDLQPFCVVEREGFKEFCGKNIGYSMPSAGTLASTALVDLFTVLKDKVTAVLDKCVSGTLMMDGWTDRYNARPYFAIRISVVHKWIFKIFTLAIQPVESHKSASLSRFVKDTLAEYLPPLKKFLLFNTTDGAANMLLLSKLLGHDRISCVAHGIHLLLTVDSINKEREVENLLVRCKEIVKTLHFKAYMLSAEEIKGQDVQLFEKIGRLQDELMADEENPVSLMDNNNNNDIEVTAMHEEPSATSSAFSGLESDLIRKVVHKHATLKASMPVRWNSTLTMVESILDLRQPICEVLKKLAKSDMILDKDDFELLQQLRQFLTMFNDITNLISENSPNLALIPLIRTNITKSCQSTSTDLPVMKRIKKSVLDHMDRRIPISTLVKISAALDPSVRDIVLSKDDSSSLLEEAYNELYHSPYGDRIFSAPHDELESLDDQDIEEDAIVIDQPPVTAATPVATTSKIYSKSFGDSCPQKKLKLALIQQAIGASPLQAVNESPVRAEIRKYLAMSDTGDSLKFWENNAADFPLLSAMARVYLALSPGSVPVECLFSTAGLILNGKRSSLSPYRVNMICFVHDNYARV